MVVAKMKTLVLVGFTVTTARPCWCASCADILVQECESTQDVHHGFTWFRNSLS
jgi:hypothetical protein